MRAVGIKVKGGKAMGWNELKNASAVVFYVLVIRWVEDGRRIVHESGYGGVVRKYAQNVVRRDPEHIRAKGKVAVTNTACGRGDSPRSHAGEISFVHLGGQIPIDASTLPNADLPTDPNMSDLEDVSNAFLNDGIFSRTYDDDDVGAESDFNNMDNTIDASPIPTLRVHKDHPKA
ncbi:hypothetical protein Tco_0471913 [Tanacetum coccineum]